MLEAMLGQKPVHRRSNPDWPIMGRIKLKYWKGWENFLRQIFCNRGAPTSSHRNWGGWKNPQSQEWDTFVFRSTKTLIWRRVEGDQEKWYKHGNPTKTGGTIYNVTTGVEIPRPKRAVCVTLKSQSKKTWVFHQGTRKFTNIGTKHK